MTLSKGTTRLRNMPQYISFGINKAFEERTHPRGLAIKETQSPIEYRIQVIPKRFAHNDSHSVLTQ